MNGDQAAVIFDTSENKVNDASKEDKETEQPAKPPVYWMHGKSYILKFTLCPLAFGFSVQSCNYLFIYF